MPSIFKALASIAAWVLFIGGCVSVLTTTANWVVLGSFIGEPPLGAFLGWGLRAVNLALAAVVMKLSHLME